MLDVSGVLGGYDHDFVRRDPARPDHAMFVVAAVLFDGGLQAPRGADTVTAHHGHDHLPIRAVHLHDLFWGLAVDLLELEDVPQLDAAALLEHPLALGASVARLRVVEIEVLVRQRQIVSEVDVEQVLVFLVATAQEVHHALYRDVEEDGNLHLEVDGASESDGCAGDLQDSRRVGEHELIAPETVAKLHFVDRPVATHTHGHGLAVGEVNDGLHHLRRGHAEVLLKLFDRSDFRRGLLAHRLDRILRRERDPAGSFLAVATVAAVAAVQERVFALVGDDHELHRAGATDGAAVGLHGEDVDDPEELEDLLVRLALGLERSVHALGIDVEAVGVEHLELAPADESKARTRFVSELRTDLVERERQLRTALEHIRRLVDDDFLSSGREAVEPVIGLVVVGPDREHRPALLVLVPAARELPKLSGVEDGHLLFDASDRIHLLPDDLVDLPQDPQTQVLDHGDSGGDHGDEPGSDEQLVAHDLRTLGVVPQGPREHLGVQHRLQLLSARLLVEASVKRKNTFSEL